MQQIADGFMIFTRASFCSVIGYHKKRMSDPTYVDGWKTTDPMQEIRKQRTEIELIGSFNKNNQNGAIDEETLIKTVISELTKRYKYTPDPEFVKSHLDILIHVQDLTRGM